MRELARQAMLDGAFGFSTGLTYPPGAFSDTNELVSVCEAIADLGGFYMSDGPVLAGRQAAGPLPGGDTPWDAAPACRYCPTSPTTITP